MAYIQSPCIRNCSLDVNEICLGCFRSMDEIMEWSHIETSAKQKQQILTNAKMRKDSCNK